MNNNNIEKLNHTNTKWHLWLRYLKMRCHERVWAKTETQSFYLQYSIRDQQKFYEDKLHTSGFWDLAT